MVCSYIIGVAGGSGSGKTFFAQTLMKKLGPAISSILYQDNYYFDQSMKFDEDGGNVNFDHPEAIDFKLLAHHLRLLKSGRSIDVPLYDFATHSRRIQTDRRTPKRVIIVDGILIFHHPELRELFDRMIFVETPQEIRFQRRLERDVMERGRTPEGVKKQFEKQVKPMHDLFVEPSKVYADCISSGTDMDAFYKLLRKVEEKSLLNTLPPHVFSPAPFTGASFQHSF